jgi:hypothetical protein
MNLHWWAENYIPKGSHVVGVWIREHDGEDPETRPIDVYITYEQSDGHRLTRSPSTQTLKELLDELED